MILIQFVMLVHGSTSFKSMCIAVTPSPRHLSSHSGCGCSIPDTDCCYFSSMESSESIGSTYLRPYRNLHTLTLLQCPHPLPLILVLRVCSPRHHMLFRLRTRVHVILQLSRPPPAYLCFSEAVKPAMMPPVAIELGNGGFRTRGWRGRWDNSDFPPCVRLYHFVRVIQV